MKITAAFPRNRLHLRFLEEYSDEINKIWIRDRKLYEFALTSHPKLASKLEFIDRELRLSLKGFIRTITFNNRYYKKLHTKLKAENITCAIIFLASEPLEIFLLDKLGANNIELWEEGLQHYLKNRFFYLLIRRFFQVLSGYYFKSLLKIYISHDEVKTRDRFAKCNLHIPIKKDTSLARQVHAVAFIANAIVDDKTISLKSYVQKVKDIANDIQYELHYFPHPRESDYVIDALMANGIIVVKTSDTLAHLTSHRYKLYLSPLSSTLLELGAPEKIMFCPGIFNLKAFEKELKATKKFNFPIASKITDIYIKLDGGKNIEN